MFKITDKKGFHITFKNGYTVSVQFGPWNHCDNKDLTLDFEYSTKNEIYGAKGSKTAQCAVIGKDGELIRPEGWDDDVKGYMTPEEILKVFNEVASF